MEKHEIEFLKRAVKYCIQNQIKLDVSYDQSENVGAKLLPKINELNDYLRTYKRDFIYNEGSEVETFDGSKAKILNVEEVTYFIEDEKGYKHYATGAQIVKRSNVLKIA